MLLVRMTCRSRNFGGDVIRERCLELVFFFFFFRFRPVLRCKDYGDDM